jgi:hypothetical protein
MRVRIRIDVMMKGREVHEKKISPLFTFLNKGLDWEKRTN